MNLPCFVRLESGLLLNISQLSVIHPRQPNGSIRVQAQGGPLIVISPVTDNDEREIHAAVDMLRDWLIQQLLGKDATLSAKNKPEKRVA